MAVDRSKLTARIPPSMSLSNGTDSSMTPPPRTLNTAIPPRERAHARFGVEGNAIVTGGAGGIGSVACRALLEHGLQGVAIFDLYPLEAQITIDKLQQEFPSAVVIFIKVDITKAESVTEAVAQAENRLGPINVLLCFAGVTNAVNALDISERAWRTMFEVNTMGSFLCAQAVAKTMVRNEIRGSVILMASVSGYITNFPQPHVHYNASKSAVLSMKSSLAAEWARFGIRVNSISPGYMDTILNEGEGLEEHRRTWKGRIPFGRMGQPEELTGAIILLASEAASYITGTDIIVDGGLTVF